MIDIEALLQADAQRWQREVAAHPTHDYETVPAAAEARRHLRRAPVLGAALVVALVAAAVAWVGVARNDQAPVRPAGSMTSGLVGVTWTDPNSPSTVVFTEHTARFFDGCSNLLESVTYTPGQVVIGGQVGAQSTCTGRPAPAPGTSSRAAYDHQQAALDRFKNTLRGRVAWARSGHTLHLTNAAGASLDLITNGAPAPSLTGQAWALERVQAHLNSGPTEPYITSATLRIDSDGTVHARDLCAELSGPATITETTVDFSRVAVVGSKCIDPGFTPETATIDAVLSTKVTFSIRGNELILSGPDGNALIYTTR